ncbi:MAG: hypothetical protein SLAVMIC_00481 [uncultured marine phage]|uniref:Uncharacterized protein n=1 Tax=uncultured marine phage TaxID=707152 RepID=A0A8D9FS65_9VIRU|nr:MAG: hypothetical protein SLAVMIC_00481 [uncultured marine phage]
MIKKFNENFGDENPDCDECYDLGVVECPNCAYHATDGKNVECDICDRKEVRCPKCEDPSEDSDYNRAVSAEQARLRIKQDKIKAERELKDKQSKVWLGQHYEGKVAKFSEYVSENVDQKVGYVCGECGSDDLRWDAWAEWNEDLQKMELLSTMDSCYCEPCGKETDQKEVNI